MTDEEFANELIARLTKLRNDFPNARVAIDVVLNKGINEMEMMAYGIAVPEPESGIKRYNYVNPLTILSALTGTSKEGQELWTQPWKQKESNPAK